MIPSEIYRNLTPSQLEQVKSLREEFDKIQGPRQQRVHYSEILETDEDDLVEEQPPDQSEKNNRTTSSLIS
jgi:hypothetical protein